jgi:uncharacterized protein (TIGR02246 family)
VVPASSRPVAIAALSLGAGSRPTASKASGLEVVAGCSIPARYDGSASVAPGNATDMDDLLRLERAGWDSLCDGSGADFYGSVMTDDALMVLANGEAMTRSDVVAALAKSPPWASYEMQDVRVVQLNDDSAALVYVGVAHRTDDDEPFVGAMSSVYVRRDGEWRLALYQQTPRR